MNGQGEDERPLDILHAVGAGDCARVEELIERGLDIDVKDDKGRTAYLVAAEEGCFECLNVLIGRVDDINQQDGAGDTALHATARRGHSECMETLIVLGINVNRRNVKDESAVCVAAVNGHVQCVRKLLYDRYGDVRADFSLWRESDNNSLCEAAGSGHFDCVDELLYNTYAVENDEGEHYELFQIKRHMLPYEELVKLKSSKSRADAERKYSEQNRYAALCCASILSEHKCLAALIGTGVDVNNVYKAIGEITPLCYAAEYGSYECVRALLDAGANVLPTDNLNRSALHRALSQTSSYDEHLEQIVRALIQAGTNVNVKDSSGKTAIFVPAEDGEPDIMEMLIEAGADVNVVSTDGKLPLHYASKSGVIECVSVLLIEGALVNVRDKQGQTPLALAAKRQSDDCVRHLILAGSNIYARDMSNELVMDKDWREKCGAEIKASEEKTEAILTAAWKGENEKITSLIEDGADVNVKCEDGTTALIAASWEGHDTCVDILLRVDKIDINARDYCDRTALFATAFGGHNECMKIILSHTGVLVDSQNSDKITPLMVAANREKLACVDALICAGADATTKDDAGYTTLMTAAKTGSIECLRTLIKACSSISTSDALFKDALVIAIAYANAKCVEILFEHLPASMRSLSEVNQLIRQTYLIYDRKHDDIMSTLFKAGIFHWEFYTVYDGMTYKGGIRNLTRDLILNGYTPDQFQWRGMTCTPLQYAFRILECGTVRYLLANLYLTPYDVRHIQRDFELAKYVRENGSVNLQSLHHQLVSQPWLLEVLSTLGVFNLLRRYGRKQEEAVRCSGISEILPDMFLRRLAFHNPIRYLCTHDWDKIEGKFMNLNLPLRPSAENMVKKAKCPACSSECMTVKADTQQV